MQRTPVRLKVLNKPEKDRKGRVPIVVDMYMETQFPH